MVLLPKGHHTPNLVLISPFGLEDILGKWGESKKEERLDRQNKYLLLAAVVVDVDEQTRVVGVVRAGEGDEARRLTAARATRDRNLRARDVELSAALYMVKLYRNR